MPIHSATPTPRFAPPVLGPGSLIASKVGRGVPVLALQSTEEIRVIESVAYAALLQPRPTRLVVWRETTGFTEVILPTPPAGGRWSPESAMAALQAAPLREAKEPDTEGKQTAIPAVALEFVLTSVMGARRATEDAAVPGVFFVFCDLAPFYASGANSKFLRYVRDIAQHAGATGFRLFLLSPTASLPPEWASQVSLYVFPPCGAPQFRPLVTRVARRLCAEQLIASESVPAEAMGGLLDALQGLTLFEAEHALNVAAFHWARARALRGEGSPGALSTELVPFLLHEKASAIAGVPGLDFVIPRVSMEDVGGLSHLRTWLRRVKAAMTARAREQGIDQPKGVLLLGPGGTGKSLVAQALAHDFHVPLIRLRLSDFYASELGQTEARVKQATTRISGLGRCVVLLDEMDKAFGGAQSSDKTDGGATSRLVGHFLTWMDENTTGAFVVFTANNLQNVPAELFRNGRIDRTFVFMHPDETARREVLQLHLAKRGHELAEIAHHDDITDIVERLDGFLQAEIEQVVKEAGFIHHLAREDAAEAALAAGLPAEPLPFTAAYLRQAIAEANPMVRRNPDGLDYYHRQLGAGAQLAGPLPLSYRARGPEALTNMDR